MQLRKQITTLVVILFSVTIIYGKDIKLCGVEWPPFTYVENNFIVKGISYEIYEHAFHLLGKRFIAHKIPWPRCRNYVKKGEYDAIIDADTLEFIIGTFPTSFYPVGVYTRFDFPEDKFSWDLVRGKRIGMIRGHKYTDIIGNFNNWIKDFASNEIMMIQKLKANRYDFIISDLFAAHYFAKTVGIKIKMLKPILDFGPNYLAFNRDRKKLLKDYDKIIGLMIQDGTLDRIYLKYLPYSYSELKKMASKPLDPVPLDHFHLPNL